MESVYFSPSLLSFIPARWKDDGTYTTETWPADAVMVTDEVAQTFWKQTPPDGKQLGAVDGEPAWVDVPPPTQEQLVATAEQQKVSLRATADRAIAPLQDAVDLDMATDDEKAALTAWRKYRVLLNRVDTTKAPDITWPDQPAE
ncbi:tail fiber assembly protein [Elizabethkingia phage EKP1]|nr:tail fiber assembly protein [Elizabethkingia phage EKP1]